jgi:hypothetical protein
MLNYGVEMHIHKKKQVNTKLNALLDKLLFIERVLQREVREPMDRYRVDDIYQLVRELDNERKSRDNKLY